MIEREIVMTGLELITGRIISDAEQKAAEKTAAARAQIAAIKAEYQTEIENVKKNSAQRLEEAERRIKESAESAKRAKIREAVLKAKNEAVESVIAEARTRILALPDAEYFALLSEIYKNNAEDKEGEILFTAADKKRMPKDFVDGLCKIRGRVTLSKEDAPGAGFVIRYGRVEQNCTIDAIFEDKRNRLSDIASKE